MNEALLGVIVVCCIAHLILQFLMAGYRSKREVIQWYVNELNKLEGTGDYGAAMEIAIAADLFIESRK